MAVKIHYKTMGFERKDKIIEIPFNSTNIHLEYGSFTADDGIYLWYKNKYDVWKTKKLVTTKWKYKLDDFKIKIVR